MIVEEKINKFKDKNIVVVGLARSGAGAANLLSALGARVTVTDKKSRESLNDSIKKLSPSVNVITDGNPPEIFDRADMVVLSPGVPLDAPLLDRARTKGIPVIGELELAYQAIKTEQRAKSKEQRAKKAEHGKLLTPHFIGITGTNGKSTTTTLVDLMLKESGFKTLLGGNIGNALTEEILKAHPLSLDYIVAEISSFQLETIEEFRPRIAAILNITPDHLDRYEGMEDYLDAKLRIFENQMPEDFLVLNADDDVLMKLYDSRFKIQNSKSPRVLFFSRKREVEGVYFKDGMIYLNSSYFSLPASHFPLISQKEIKIQGVHNIENAMAAALVSLVAGCSPDAVRNVLKSFPGLEHRLEFAGEVRGVKFINDSKGTNVGAVLKSLEGFENVILIMGGLDKGSDFSILKNPVEQKVKALVLIGKAKD
ncbi:MAG: UDP-N-acetylmuramoyl-L-alanine--D-glutamate ligase, partial [Nitrospiraceae bacterium]